MPTAAPSLRHAATVAAVATGVTTAAHETAHLIHGDVPAPAAVLGGALASFVLLVGLQQALTGRRRPRWDEVLTHLLIGQAVVHALLAFAATYAGSAATSTVPLADPTMLAAHVWAALVHAVLVLGARRCAQAAGLGVAAVLRRLHLPGPRPASMPVAPARVRLAVVPHPAVPPDEVVAVRGIRGRRGPPRGPHEPAKSLTPHRPRSPPCP